MTPKEYNAMPEGDTKLAARCAITCGWMVELHGVFDCVYVSDTNQNACGYRRKYFNPFTDPSIPYGLIGLRGKGLISDLSAPEIYGTGDDAKWLARADCSDMFLGGCVHAHNASKTHAIIHAFCAADPLGHWARFMKGGE